MNNGEIITEQLSATFASKNLSGMTSRLEITAIMLEPAHRNCNLTYKIPNYIPIVFHNLNGYDARFLIRELGKKYDTGKIGVIAENKEKYISFTVDVVVDSYMEDSGEVKDLRS